MKKKLLLISESLGGGVRRHIIDLVYGLDKQKFDVYLLYSKDRADDIFLNQVNELKNYVTLIESRYMVREISIKKDFKAYREIKYIIKKVKPDIVHCHSSKAGVLGRVAAKRLSVKKIFYTPHAYYFQNPKVSKKKKFIYIVIEQVLSKFFTTKTFNVSNGEKQCALDNKIDKENKFATIYNGIEDIDLPSKENMRKSLGISQNAFVIGVTARLDEQKDPFTFVKIAKNIILKHNNVHFVYIGDGPLFEKVLDYIKQNNLENNVHLLGFRNDADKVVSAFDLYLITSLYEGMPYSPIEAMRAGVPIIATDTIGNNEIVFPNQNGYLFAVGNVLQGTSAVNMFIENKKSIKFNVRKVFKKFFLKNNMIENIENEYINS
ncbi:glycosyltransferase family 4 protein [Clostridium tyrobutyricum]|uniref:glycosyltransferase family 4 protein n=1 Tax=Clostridium tyrobutyricum TaxID=1519 RepID=UPI00073D9A34|nr:glycosyltransferase family 4 protein [Clostridium tyrobutyricum]